MYQIVTFKHEMGNLTPFGCPSRLYKCSRTYTTTSVYQ